MSISKMGNPITFSKSFSTYYPATSRFVKVHTPYEPNAKNLGGVPLMYDAEKKALSVDSSDNHTIIFGSTGSLKTRAVVLPTIKVLADAGESMVINDPKGELQQRMAGDLEHMGYKIIVVDFRDPAIGNCWNPLYLPYKFYLQNDIDRAAEFANDISVNLMLPDGNVNDPFWNNSAADMFFGLILLLFRYCQDHNETEGVANLSNLIALRKRLLTGGQRAKLSDLWKYAQEDELIYNSLSGVILTADETMGGILSTWDNRMRTFTIQPTLLNMLANNDFDIGMIGQEKTAVFLITPDEKTAYHRLVSLFVKQSYEYLIYVASHTKDKKVPVRVNFLLDEFSTLPAINDMPAMISAARSRDIRFLLVVQSRKQLDFRYHEEADTIISNCSNWIFLTSRELGLLREISELCGLKKDGTPNITVYDLQHFSKKNYEALVMAGRLEPIKTNLLDIDRFGAMKYIVADIKTNERQKRKMLSFDLKDEIIDRLHPERKQIDEILGLRYTSSRVITGIKKSLKYQAFLRLSGFSAIRNPT